MQQTVPNLPTRPAATTARRVAWIVAALSLLALLVSILLLGRAIAAYQKQGGRHQFYYNEIGSTQFQIAGRPVAITQDVDDQGRGTVTVAYAKDLLTLNVEIPNRNPLPLLIRQEDWFRVFRWADGTAMNSTEFAQARASGQRPESVVIVTRSLAPGAPPGSWGDIWKDQWVFNFYTLLPPPQGAAPDEGGGFAHERWEYPESPRAYERRVDAARLAGQPIPQRNPRELKEDTWQYGAAMLVMPAGSAPPYAFNRGVLIQNRAYVAVASVSILAIVIGLAVALAPSRDRSTLPSQ